MPVIRVNANTCTGCRTCELICSYRHGAKDFNPALSRIQIKRKGMEKETPLLCRQCRHPKCLAGCQHGALNQDTLTGAINLNPRLCNSCGSCIKACPFGAISVDVETGLPLICDLCGGEPACVSFCPGGVLALVKKGGEEN